MTTITKINPVDYRQTEYPIDPIFINRWSPRSFLDKPIGEETLFSLFEAAKWAPSAANWQPWRFIIARSKEDRAKFNSFIFEGNTAWCEKAPVLAVIISKKLNPEGKPNRAHAFDAGAAWGFLSIEAAKKGLITHGMGGFDQVKAREVLHIPEEFDIHAVIAIGYQGEKEELPEAYQEREKPSGRRKLEETVFEGEFQ
ncbi:MAG TPA: nitroreductase family protein [Bacillales bacterium]|nr:nitroreductase family protein [Bacillales bacterium]